MSDAHDEQGWDQGWRGHDEAQARRLAALPFAEKLAWLEEAHARVLRMRAAAQPVREGAPPDLDEPRTDPPGGA